jgi:hypothetical protein
VTIPLTSAPNMPHSLSFISNALWATMAPVAAATRMSGCAGVAAGWPRGDTDAADLPHHARMPNATKHLMPVNSAALLSRVHSLHGYLDLPHDYRHYIWPII